MRRCSILARVALHFADGDRCSHRGRRSRINVVGGGCARTCSGHRCVGREARRGWTAVTRVTGRVGAVVFRDWGARRAKVDASPEPISTDLPQSGSPYPTTRRPIMRPECPFPASPLPPYSQSIHTRTCWTVMLLSILCVSSIYDCFYAYLQASTSCVASLSIPRVAQPPQLMPGTCARGNLQQLE